MLLERLIEWSICRKLGNLDPKDVPSDAELTPLEDAENGIIAVSENGFRVEAPKYSAAMEWNKVTSIFSYRRDLLATDLICLAFGAALKDRAVEAHEHMTGFLTLRREAERRCPGFSESFDHWLLNSRAFVTTPICLWEKSKA